MRRIALLIAMALTTLAAAPKKRVVSYDAALPALGTKFHSLPAGPGKDLVEASCIRCHSADMLAQQRLTEKQWTATVEKMMRWGAVVKDEDKTPIITYLAKHFGPDNRAFNPAKARPVGY
jgi:hypothetical protein